ncbi:MAG: PspC domain-containing protein [Candidatus Diapherotrites archaeon]
MAKKKLYLSKDKKIGGVLGGIAEYLNVDATVVRLIAVVVFLLALWQHWWTTIGLIAAYIVAWAIIPRRE